MHCRRFLPMLSRRDMLVKCANGFGAVALAGLLHDQAPAQQTPANPLTPRPSHFRPGHAASSFSIWTAGHPNWIRSIPSRAWLANTASA